MDNLSIFEVLYPTFKIKKPIRLIELFAGYGSQALALEYLAGDSIVVNVLMAIFKQMYDE